MPAGFGEAHLEGDRGTLEKGLPVGGIYDVHTGPVRHVLHVLPVEGDKVAKDTSL